MGIAAPRTPEEHRQRAIHDVAFRRNGWNDALEEAAICLERRLIMSDFPRDLETVRDGAAAIRALKDE